MRVPDLYLIVNFNSAVQLLSAWNQKANLLEDRLVTQFINFSRL